MTKAFARFAVIDSRRWIRFLLGLLPKLDSTNFAALPPVEQRMLQMFYVTLWGKTAESWEDEEVLDNLYGSIMQAAEFAATHEGMCADCYKATRLNVA